MWRYRDETGYLDCLEKQMVGRDCFPGSPKVLPSKYFDLYKDRDKWLVWLYASPSSESHRITFKQPDQEWKLLGEDPAIIEDGTLLKLGPSGHAPQMVFRLTTCTDATEIRALWDLPVWNIEEIDPTKEPSLSEVPAPARHTASGLIWVAWFLARYQWAAVGSIAVFAFGLLALSSGYVTIPEAIHHDNKTLRD
jgi:hypothetical protein